MDRRYVCSEIVEHQLPQYNSREIKPVSGIQTEKQDQVRHNLSSIAIYQDTFLIFLSI